MKRSEMISRLQEIIMNVTELESTVSEAEEILSAIEKLGMKPPCLDSDKCQVLMQVYMDPSFNRWDEEFDSKPELVERLERRKQRKRKVK